MFAFLTLEKDGVTRPRPRPFGRPSVCTNRQLRVLIAVRSDTVMFVNIYTFDRLFLSLTDVRRYQAEAPERRRADLLF